MGCNDRSAQLRRGAWTLGSTTQNFLGALQVPVNKAGSVRVSVDVEATTGTIVLSRAVRYSNDGITWGSPTTFGSALSSGDNWGSAFQALDTTYQLAEVGVVAANGAGDSVRQQAQLNIKIDVREP